MAMTAWAAKVFRSATSVSENKPTVSRPTKIAPRPRASESRGAMMNALKPTISAARRPYCGTSESLRASGY